MSVKTFAVSVGFDKNGEPEFDVHLSNVIGFDYDEMQKVRAMIPVAIFELERIWQDHGPPSKERAQCAAARS